MKVIEKKKERLLDDFIRVDRSVIQYELFNGSLSKELVRLNVDRGESAAALLFNPERESFIFVKQFRYPVYTKNPKGGWILEIVAGTIDKKDTPEQTIRREIEEEAGVHVKKLTKIFSFYPSPGASNEIIHLFYGEISPRQTISAGGGVISEGEDIRIVELSVDEAMKRLDKKKIIDAKTIIALQWYRLNH